VHAELSDEHVVLFLRPDEFAAEIFILLLSGDLLLSAIGFFDVRELFFIQALVELLFFKLLGSLGNLSLFIVKFLVDRLLKLLLWGVEDRALGDRLVVLLVSGARFVVVAEKTRMGGRAAKLGQGQVEFGFRSNVELDLDSLVVTFVFGWHRVFHSLKRGATAAGLLKLVVWTHMLREDVTSVFNVRDVNRLWVGAFSEQAAVDLLLKVLLRATLLRGTLMHDWRRLRAFVRWELLNKIGILDVLLFAVNILLVVFVVKRLLLLDGNVDTIKVSDDLLHKGGYDLVTLLNGRAFLYQLLRVVVVALEHQVELKEGVKLAVLPLLVHVRLGDIGHDVCLTDNLFLGFVKASKNFHTGVSCWRGIRSFRADCGRSFSVCVGSGDLLESPARCVRFI
jgi:hypothetical protein